MSSLSAKAKEPADEAERFLASIKFPEPAPGAAKPAASARLAPEHFLASIKFPEPAPGAAKPAASAGLARPPSPADSLPDYDDLQDQPEGPFGMTKEDDETEEDEAGLVEEQPYWSNPTKEGAIMRWAIALHKDSVPLDDALSWETFSSDLSSLRKLSVSTSHAYLVLPRNFETVTANHLLMHHPSPAIYILLWSDLLDASHTGRHTQTPRKCWCPLWVPAQQKSWEEELREIEREQLKVDDLEEIGKRVFGKKREDGLLEVVHEMNWLWFDQIFQLACIKQTYRRHASEDLVDDLRRKITRLGAEHQQELASVQKKLAHAERAGASAKAVNDLDVDIELTKSAWSAREDELKALEKRLSQRLEENTGMARGPTEVTA
ncbi:hypothetical protein JCM1840_002369 [Sporobolomyces johnsonii]